MKVGQFIKQDGKTWEIVEVLSPIHARIRELWTMNEEYYWK